MLDSFLMAMPLKQEASAQEMVDFINYYEENEKISPSLPKEKAEILLSLYRKGELEPFDIGYWHRAEAIHEWFIKNVQGNDDDQKIHIVTKEQIIELLNLCKKVWASSKLINGKVIVASHYTNGETKPIYEDGLVIKDPQIPKKLLPCNSGIFEKYDKCYLEDIKETIEILTAVLEEVDFEKEVVLYQASW